MHRPPDPQGDKLLERISRRYEQLSEQLQELESKLEQAAPDRLEAQQAENESPPQKPR